MVEIDTIFIHCSATRADWMISDSAAEKVAEIRRWHTDPRPKGRGWRDIGYHWVIDRDGTVVAGRKPESRAGAHVRGHNTGSIGICLIGGHGSSEHDAFSENFTFEQDAALRRLISEIGTRHPISHVRGHNEVAAKACPGFQVSMWWAGQHVAPPPKKEKEVVDVDTAKPSKQGSKYIKPESMTWRGAAGLIAAALFAAFGESVGMGEQSQTVRNLFMTPEFWAAVTGYFGVTIRAALK